MVCGAGLVAGCSSGGSSPTSALTSRRRSRSIVGMLGGLRIPEEGCYWGADDTTRGFTGPSGIEVQLGRRMAIRNRHYDWNNGAVARPGAAERRDRTEAVISMISQEGRGGGFPVVTSHPLGDTAIVDGHQGLDRITAGEFDAGFNAAFVEMRTHGAALIYRLFMEMNSPHTPFHADHQGGDVIGQGRYVRAWRHVWGLADAVGATTRAGGNVIFVYCPQAYSRDDPNQWQKTYPGDDVVDIFGLDLYRDTFVDGADNTGEGRGFYQYATAHQKPFMICESGFEQDQPITTADGRFDKDGSITGHSLIREHAQAIKTAYPNTIAFVTWNNHGPVGNDYIDTSQASLTQYQAWTHDPYYNIKNRP